MIDRNYQHLSLCRVYAALKEHKRLDTNAIALKCFLTLSGARKVMSKLKQLGLAHVHSHIYSGRYPVNVWQFGYGEDAKYEKEDQNKVKRRYRQNRKERIADMFGRKYIEKITRSRNFGGADRVVIDGKTVYQRAKKARVIPHEHK